MPEESSSETGSGIVDASQLSKKEATALRRERIGIVFQQANLLPALTVREQLLVMAELGGSRRSPRATRIREHVDGLLDAVGLLRPCLASAATSSRAVSVSERPSRAVWSMRLRCCSWTSPRAPSTRSGAPR